MISADDFKLIVDRLGQQAVDDIEWANGCVRPQNDEQFALEAIYVICNSGMRFTVARIIYDKVVAAINDGRSASTVFKHKGKARAIDRIWRRRKTLFTGFLVQDTDEERLDYLRDLPWIGGITCYHLAKNFGAQVAKPDVHLQRLADREGVSAQTLCERLARETGHKVSAIDTVLWRACATGVMNSKTGVIG